MIGTVWTTEFALVETPRGGFHLLSGYSRLIVGGFLLFEVETPQGVSTFLGGFHLLSDFSRLLVGVFLLFEVEDPRALWLVSSKSVQKLFDERK